MIISFAEATVGTGGGKAANLGELLRAGLPVPDGFVVTAEAYRQLAAEVDLDYLLSQGADQVRKAVESLPVSETLTRQIAERLALLGENIPVAVRSSATAEDLPDASFAGQQDTFLGVTGTEEVLAATRRCWGSLWTERAVDYRERNGFDHHGVALAVVIQQLIDSDVSGVLFTQNPVTGKETLINASWGLGESVVSGVVTPDEFRATTTKVLERSVGTKQTRIDRDGSGTVTTEVPTEDRARLCLSDAQVLKLVEVGQQVEAHFGQPMDIEWAFAEGHLWLLQARPITTSIPAESAVSSAPTTTVTGRRIGKLSKAFHHDLIEHYPGPFPLDVAAVVSSYHQLQSGMKAVGICVTPASQLIQVDEDGTVKAAYPDVRLGWKLLRLLTYPAPDPEDWPRVEEAFRRRIFAALPADLRPLADADLFKALDNVLGLVNEITRTRFVDYIGPAQLVSIRLGLYLRLARRSDLDSYALLGDLAYTTATIDHELYRLTRLDSADAEFISARQSFLDRFGARTSKLYLPFSNRSWREDRAAFDAALEAVRRAGKRQGNHEGSHADVVAKVRCRLPFFLRKGFDKTVEDWRAGHIAREASVYLVEEGYCQARRVTDEIAHRLVDSGKISTIDQLKYLTMDEVREALLGAVSDHEVQEVVTRRLNARPTTASTWWASTVTNDSADVTGIAGSPGVATGPARIISGPEEFDRLQEGDILVCQYTDPSWTPLFGLAAGVIADTGGRLSHAAIVAREYGIPAVMGAHGATSSVIDGELVTVNGTAGTVIRQLRD